MVDIISGFSMTLDYLNSLIIVNHFESEFSRKIDEQRKNLEDLKQLLKQYDADITNYKMYEAIDSDETLFKLMKIHKFITDFEWHISEIRDLKDEIIKFCSVKRELRNQ